MLSLNTSRSVPCASTCAMAVRSTSVSASWPSSGHDYLALGIPAPLERDAIYDAVEHVHLEDIDHIDTVGRSSAAGRS